MQTFGNPNAQIARGIQAENLSLFGYFVKCLKNYANFKGRARRKEYWSFTLFYSIIHVFILVVSVFVGAIMIDKYGHVPEYLESISEGVSWVLILPFLVPDMAVFVRRMHDIGKSGAWVWLWIAANICSVLSQKKSQPIFVGIFGLLLFVSYTFIIFYSTRKGNVGENQYGPDPK